MNGILVGLGGLVAAWLDAGFTNGLVAGIWFFLVSGVLMWLGYGLLAQPRIDDVSPLSPLSAWRRDQAAGFGGAFAVALMTWLVVALVFGYGTVSEIALRQGFELGLWDKFWISVRIAALFKIAEAIGVGICAAIVYLIVCRPTTWPAFLAFVQLRWSEQTPIRLIRFLEDARHRDILRTVGTVYQFRHARLQDRLAAQADSGGSAKETVQIRPEARGSWAEDGPA
jgi:hypothetical protein